MKIKWDFWTVVTTIITAPAQIIQFIIAIIAMFFVGVDVVMNKAMEVANRAEKDKWFRFQVNIIQYISSALLYFAIYLKITHGN